jgi:arsenite-transporting ATPase
VAAATALRCAELGHRTVVISTDAAHSLADSFDRPLGPEPTPIVPDLWGQEIDILHQMEKYWGTVKNYLASVLAWRGMDELIAEETSVLPGMEELASLLQIVYLQDSGDYDVVIVDCAPTGETLRLLAFPEAARWYLQRIFPLERKAAQVARPLVRAVIDMPFPDDEVFESLKQLLESLDRMKALLSDPQQSSVRLVLNPEKMVIKEAQRTFTYLNLYGYSTDLIISNRLIPGQVTDQYFEAWKDTQEKYGRMIEEAFSPLPILRVPLFDQEIVGLDMLRRMADAVYNSDDPIKVYFVGNPQRVEKRNGTYILNLRLPFVTKDEIQLTRSNDELIVHIGNWKRNLILPHVLIDLEIDQARFEGNALVLTFCNRSEDNAG